MYTSRKAAFALGVVAALLWSPHFYVVSGLHAEGVPMLAAQFHLLFWPALAFLLVLFLGGRTSSLSVFQRRESYFLVLAAAGGYGFWMLRGLALEGGGHSHAHLLFYAAPLLMVLFSRFTPEKADWRSAAGLLLGFVGCVMIAERLTGPPGATGAAGGADLLALGAAACWALFSVMARPVVRDQSVLPMAALVTGIGAVCLFITCLSTGESPFDVSLPQLQTLVLTGIAVVGLMMAAWLKCLAGLPAAAAAPFWYLGLPFGLLWAHRAGWGVAGWWALGGVVLIFGGLRYALSGRRRAGITMSDIIRGQG